MRFIIGLGYGYPISKSELIVLVYGGLRGALGLCLSLMVGVDQELPIRFRHLTVFYMACMAALTNLVNGTTCKPLVNVYGFKAICLLVLEHDRDSNYQEEGVQNVLGRVH
jgi:NhaP-type Na+/H+ or K+/H+ antiporter